MKNPLRELYCEELQRPETNYFVLDAAGEPHSHEDVDFVKYGYSTSRFNQVNVGDLFLYRRPRRSSHNGRFYFYGCGKVGALHYINKRAETYNEVNISIEVSKPLRFQRIVSVENLADFPWAWKDRGKTWLNFFHQYGMNKIPRQDFLGISDLAFDKSHPYDHQVLELEVILHKKLQQEDYSVADSYGLIKTRGVAQRIFAQQLNENYRGICCATGITTRSILSASHIIPWSEDSQIRIDPKNGLLLSPLVDKLFDKYYISVDAKYKIIISDRVAIDNALYREVKHLAGKQIALPKNAAFHPKQEYLKIHRGRLKTGI